MGDYVLEKLDILFCLFQAYEYMQQNEFIGLSLSLEISVMLLLIWKQIISRKLR